MKWNCKQLADNASERLRLYVKALCAADKSTALASISLAKSLTKSGEEISISRVTIKRDGNGSNQCDFISYANI